MRNNMKLAFIFDMDGVLTDNMRLHADSWVELFRDFGLEGLDAERYLVETAGMKGVDVLRYFLDPKISEPEAQRLTELKDFLYRVMSRDLIKPMPGLYEFLNSAEQHEISLGIGTGAGPRNIDYVLDILNLTDTFQAIVNPFQVLHGKPQPDIFLRAAELLDVHPSRCIVFEDALPGVEAARKAGMKCVAVTTTNSADAFSSFENIVKIIDDFTQISADELRQLFHEKQPLTLL
ncbi:MAG: beta-phosphoglucomutase family hydrolase [Chlorobium sp.]|jgi:beta-phosphoglucomutase|nr:MAG: beta-phosphoglucomutase family hydrolase [Chlorobium sp.]